MDRPVSQPGGDGIHATGGFKVAIQRHVRGREADRAATLVAVADNPADRPRPAEFRRRPFGIAVLERAPDPRRGQRSLCVRHRRHQSQADAQGLRPAGQETGVAATPVAKGKVLPGHQVAGAEPLVQHLCDEILGGHEAEVVVERQLYSRSTPSPARASARSGGQCQPEGRVIGAKHLTRMRLECQHRQRRIRPGGVGRSDHTGVAQMDTIEIAERDSGAAGVGGTSRQLVNIRIRGARAPEHRLRRQSPRPPSQSIACAG